MDFFMQELGVPGSQLLLAAEQTLYMVFLSLFIGTVLGLIIAVTLVVTNPNGIIKNSVVYTITNTIVNIVRSVPFITFDGVYLAINKDDCWYSCWYNSGHRTACYIHCAVSCSTL